MRPAHHEGAAAAGVEHGSEQHLVVRVGHRAARAVAVIVPVEIARLHRVGREMPEHRRRQVAEDRHVRADRHDAVGIEQRGVEILFLADECANRRALDQRFHLGLCGADGAAEDFQRHRSAARGRLDPVFDQCVRAVVHGAHWPAMREVSSSAWSRRLDARAAPTPRNLAWSEPGSAAARSRNPRSTGQGGCGKAGS